MKTKYIPRHTYIERYKLLRETYPHHLRISCLINAHTKKNEIDWAHMNFNVNNKNTT